MRTLCWLLLSATTLLCAATRAPYGPQITGNASNNALLVWSNLSNEVLTIQASMRPSGGSWGAPISVSANTSASIRPEIAMNDLGNISFVWQQYLSGYQIMAAYASFGGSPSTPAQLTQDAGTCPCTALTSAGQAMLAWHRATSAYEGLGVASCPQLSTNCTIASHPPEGSSNIYPAVAICQTSGNAMIVWQEYEDDGLSAVIQAVPIPSGDSWGTPVTLSSSGTFASNPAVIYGSTGEALVKWEEPLNDGDFMCVKVASYSGGSWGTTTTLSASNSSISNADLAMNGSGTVILVAESSNGTSNSIVVAQRTSGTWSSLSTLSQDASESAYNPRVSMSATGVSGIAAVVWEGHVSSSQQGIRASCLLPASAWSAPVLISGDTSIYSANPAVWMNSGGTQAFAAWRSQASDSNTVVVNSSTYSSGSGTWTAPSTVSMQ